MGTGTFLQHSAIQESEGGTTVDLGRARVAQHGPARSPTLLAPPAPALRRPRPHVRASRGGWILTRWTAAWWA